MKSEVSFVPTLSVEESGMTGGEESCGFRSLVETSFTLVFVPREFLPDNYRKLIIRLLVGGRQFHHKSTSPTYSTNVQCAAAFAKIVYVFGFNYFFDSTL